MFSQRRQGAEVAKKTGNLCFAAFAAWRLCERLFRSFPSFCGVGILPALRRIFSLDFPVFVQYGYFPQCAMATIDRKQIPRRRFNPFIK